MNMDFIDQQAKQMIDDGWSAERTENVLTGYLYSLTLKLRKQLGYSPPPAIEAKLKTLPDFTWEFVETDLHWLDALVAREISRRNKGLTVPSRE
jgi:hypothetical protein